MNHNEGQTLAGNFVVDFDAVGRAVGHKGEISNCR
jgi:hypothetical protein